MTRTNENNSRLLELSCTSEERDFKVRENGIVNFEVNVLFVVFEARVEKGL